MPSIVLITLLIFSFGRRVATEHIRSGNFYSNTIDAINIPSYDFINVTASSALQCAAECLANTRCNAVVVHKRTVQLCSLLIFNSNVNVSYTVNSFLADKITAWLHQSVVQRNSATASKQVVTSTSEAAAATTLETTSVVSEFSSTMKLEGKLFKYNKLMSQVLSKQWNTTLVHV